LKKKKLILIGKNSFIGSNLFIFLKKDYKILILSFNQFKKLSVNLIKNYDYICNCSVKKDYVNSPYKKKNDIDLIIASKIIKTKLIYIFLSSRKIYKPKFNISENQKPNPMDIYALNKTITEKNLTKMLNFQLLILRISNVIGLKKKKNNRQINKTFFDNYLELNKSKKTIKYFNYFKDFITIEQLSKFFNLILKKKLIGVFNISLGQKVFLKELLGWLNKHNNNKSKFICLFISKKKSKEESFTLNNNKIFKKINYRPNKRDLKKFCLNLSKSIN
tara:strand:+ start:613 stop:1440 length:828 start_codon:yes stop_codon:yes gene_type:complete